MSEAPDPTHIGGFEITGRLGKGGMGAVYRARHPRTRAEVAIKVILGHLGGHEVVQERFRREVRAMASVEHPNLVRVLDAGEEDGLAYTVMRLVDGVDLATLTEREGRLSPARVAAVARGCLGALAALHEAGIVHRDLKPHNVMLERDERPVVMDLGLIKLQDARTMTKTGALIGSPRYMPPEVLAGRRSDARSDLYQLGLILWECATGEFAMPGDDFTVVAARIMGEGCPSLLEKRPDFPPELAGFVEVLAAREPSDRFPTAAAALAALDGPEGVSPEAELSGPAWPGLPGAAVTPAPGAAARPSALPRLGAAAALAALFALGFWLQGRHAGAPPAELRIQPGRDRIAARWVGGEGRRVQLVAQPVSGGPVRAVPPSGPSAVPTDAAGRASLTLTELEPGTRYRVWLEVEGERGLPREVSTVSELLPVHGVRLGAAEDGRPQLALELPLAAAATVDYPAAGGARRSARSPPTDRHALDLDGLDLGRAGALLHVEVEDPTGGRARRGFTARELLEPIGERFLERAPATAVQAAIQVIGQVFLSTDPEEKRRRTQVALEESGAPAALRGFLPFREAFFGPAAVASDLRRRVVTAIEELRRLDHCAGRAGGALDPDPTLALAGPYGLEAARAGTWTDERLPGPRRSVAGIRDPILDPKAVRDWTAPLPAPPAPRPDRGRISVRAGKFSSTEYLRVELPGGLAFFLFGDRESRAEGWLVRGFDPRDVADEGGVRVTFHPGFGGAVGSLVNVYAVRVGWPAAAP